MASSTVNALGCSDDGGGGTQSTTTTTSTTTGTGGGGHGGAGDGGSGATGGDGGAGGQGPVKPADCEDLSLTGITLVSQFQAQFDSYDSVPVVRTPTSLENLSGDPALFDRLRILYDGDLGLGVHAMDGDPNMAIPNFRATFVPNCSSCAVLQEDRNEEGQYTTRFTTRSGELELTERVTAHQTVGVVRHLELREVAQDPDTRLYDFVPEGRCLWVEEATFDVRLPGGCVPYADGACPADQFCMPLNAIGTDGQCVTGGTAGIGDPCTRGSDSWDSDCELGLRCFGAAGSATCMQVCDVQSDAPDCPAQTLCGGGYNLCLDHSILQNSGIDPALAGEVCADNPSAGYCGGAGRRGVCYDDDADGPLESMCIPYTSAASQCAAGRTAGYVAYKGGIDLSTHFCVPPL
ncbi:hypothetical protein [Chondromyces crocatus]|uniref:hypothetical protein n=1 Tax=Chondromyces crocatus TaxID=52 RepID=UPI00067C76F2|nr:hypothetical protein [Chondromyces crocatus]